MRIRRIKLYLFTIFIIGLLVSSAKSEPGWLKERIEQSQSFDYNKEADILILENSEELKIAENGKIQKKIKKAYLILSGDGIIQASFAERINPKIKLKELKGFHIKTNGKENKLGKDDAVSIASQSAAGYYNNEQITVASFSNISVNDVIAYEYELEISTEWDNFYQAFLFQVQSPVLYTSWRIEVPKSWSLHHSGNYLDPIKLTTLDEKTLLFEGTNLEYRVEEPYMPPWKYMARMLEISAFSPEKDKINEHDNWNDVARWAEQFMDSAIVGSETITAKVVELASDSETIEDKISALSDFVKNDIRYVAVEINEGRFKPRPAGTTLYNKFGDCKDKVALLRAMLAEIEVESYPILCRTDNYVDPDFPTPFQFDHCIIGIPLKYFSDTTGFGDVSDHNLLIFDPTDESTYIGILPANLFGNYMMLAHNSDSVLIKLPYLSKNDRITEYSADITLNEDMSVSAKVDLMISGYMAHAIDYAINNEGSAYLTDYLKSDFEQQVPNLVIDSIAYQIDGNTLQIGFNLSGQHYPQVVGDMTLLKGFFFEPDLKREFTAKQRIHPIWYQHSSKTTYNCRWHLPENLRISEVKAAKSDSCLTGFYDYKYTESDSSTFDIEIHEEYIGKSISAEDYEQIKNYEASLIKIKNQRLILK